jgi:hypothetical protein
MFQINLGTLMRTAFCRSCGHEWDMHFVVAVGMSGICVLSLRWTLLRCSFLHCCGHNAIILLSCLWTAVRSTLFRDYVSSCLLTLSGSSFCHASRTVYHLWGNLINFHAGQELYGAIRTNRTQCNVRCLGGDTNPVSLEHETYPNFRLI